MKTLNHTLATCLLITWTATAYADEGETDVNAPGYTTQAIITDSALANATGRIAINQAAGDLNQQTNAAALAFSPDGVAIVDIGINQQIQHNQATPPDTASVRIDGTAFANAAGLISINQTAGVANAQQNALAISIGQSGGWRIAELDETNLAHTTASTEHPEGTGTVSEVAIGPGAFQAARGVVQVNQVAGNGNATANRVYLHLDTGAF